jgi:hypothetical protein
MRADLSGISRGLKLQSRLSDTDLTNVTAPMPSPASSRGGLLHVRLWMLLNLDAWCRIHLGLGGDTEWPDELAPSGMEGASIIRTR